jgi:hypothetical protein
MSNPLSFGSKKVVEIAAQAAPYVKQAIEKAAKQAAPQAQKAAEKAGPQIGRFLQQVVKIAFTGRGR